MTAHFLRFKKTVLNFLNFLRTWVLPSYKRLSYKNETKTSSFCSVFLPVLVKAGEDHSYCQVNQILMTSSKKCWRQQTNLKCQNICYTLVYMCATFGQGSPTQSEIKQGHHAPPPPLLLWSPKYHSTNRVKGIEIARWRGANHPLPPLRDMRFICW